MIGVYIFTNIPDSSMFRFLDGLYEGFKAWKRGDRAWMGTEWFCNKHDLPQYVNIDCDQRVYLYAGQDFLV